MPAEQAASIPDAPFHRYRAFGLPILSGIPLPELSHGEDQQIPLVRICQGQVAPELAGRTASGALFEVSQSRFLLSLTGIARYLVAGGEQIVIDAAPQADEDSVRLFLMGPVFGALLHQRGLLPLHASAIETPKGAVLFAGHSGTGKSALAGAYHARGYRVITDEICALDGNFVRPGVPRLLLWPDSVEESRLWSEVAGPARPNLSKLQVPVKTGLSGDALPIHALYILNITNRNDFGISRIGGVDKLRALIDYTFRRQFLRGMESGTRYMERATTVAQSVSISRLVRSRSRALRETADLLEEDFSR